MSEAVRQVDCVVIGAGITGLNLVHQLQKQTRAHSDKPFEVLLIERKNRVGGAIQSDWCESDRGQRFLIESGPNTFQGMQKTIHGLCKELNLSPLASSSLAKNRFIFTNPGGQLPDSNQARLMPLPMDPLSFLKSPLLSWQAKLNLATEPMRVPAPSKPDPQTFSLAQPGDGLDQSVSEFVRHHFGQEVLDQILTPFITGVYAGNPEELSLKSTFPKLAAFDAEYGSIIRAGFKSAMKARQARKTANPQPDPDALPKSYRHLLFNFENGMQTLPQALAEKIPPENRLLNTRLVSLEPLPEGQGFLLYFKIGRAHV